MRPHAHKRVGPGTLQHYEINCIKISNFLTREASSTARSQEVISHVIPVFCSSNIHRPCQLFRASSISHSISALQLSPDRSFGDISRDATDYVAFPAISGAVTGAKPGVRVSVRRVIPSGPHSSTIQLISIS